MGWTATRWSLNFSVSASAADPSVHIHRFGGRGRGRGPLAEAELVRVSLLPSLLASPVSPKIIRFGTSAGCPDHVAVPVPAPSESVRRRGQKQKVGGNISRCRR